MIIVMKAGAEKSKAENIIEELEDIGFLSPADHTGKREILDDIYKNSEESQ